MPVTFTASVEDQARIEGFLAELDDEVAALLRECRAMLQERFPIAHELVGGGVTVVVSVSPKRRPRRRDR